jgi:thymidylate kinase
MDRAPDVRLITLSGIDGSGKTLLSRRLAEALSERGIAAHAICPEYRCNDVVKAFCANRFGDPYAYVPQLDPTLYISILLADWLDLARTTLAHDRDEVLICDRYLPDVLAQAVHYGADVAIVLRTMALFPTPDVLFFLGITPSSAHARLRQRLSPALHHLESEANLETLALAYERVWKLTDWSPIRLNADAPTDHLVGQLLQHVTLRLVAEQT